MSFYKIAFSFLEREQFKLMIRKDDNEMSTGKQAETL